MNDSAIKRPIDLVIYQNPGLDASSHFGISLSRFWDGSLPFLPILHVLGATTNMSTDAQRHHAGVGGRVPCVEDTLLLDSLNCIIWIADEDGTLTFMNKSWREFTGFDLDLTDKWSWFPAVHPSCQAPVRRAWEQSLSQRTAYSTKYRVRRFDGVYHWFEAYGELVTDATDHAYWAGTLVDVQAAVDDEHRDWENRQKVSQQEAILSGLIGVIPQPTALLLPPKGKILWASPSLFEVWRAPPFPNKTLKDLSEGEQGGVTRRADFLSDYGFQAFHHDGTPFETPDWPETQALHGLSVKLEHTPVIRLDETHSVFSMSGYPIRDDQHRVVAAVVMFEDITARLRHEETVIKERLLRERMELRSTFLSNVSHELKTPLTASVASISLMSKAGFTAEQHECLEAIREGCTSALQKMEDLLDITRLELGEVAVSEATFTVRSCLEHCVDRFRSRGQIEVVIDGDVPDTLIGDGPKLDRLLSVILDNACKFAREGTLAHVAVTCRRAHPSEQPTSLGTSLVLEISDDGIGIPSEIIPSLFAPFTQTDSAQPKAFGGHGIGLSIARRLCDVLNGTIHISSVVDKGTTVYVQVPFIIGRNLSGMSPLTTRKIESTDRGEKRILIAEDNILNARVLAKTLCVYGYTNVDTASDGSIAVEKFRTRQYDLVLMDCQMPRMNGYEATQRIREFDQRTPILALSADSSAMEGRWETVGMNAYLEKPFFPEKLVATIDEYIFSR